MVKDIDLVLDFVGGDTAAKSFRVMRKGGRLVSTVAEPAKTEIERYGIQASYMGSHPDFEDLDEITLLIEQGKIKTDVAEVYPIADVKKAWDVYNHKEEPQKQYTHGKIVLELQ